MRAARAVNHTVVLAAHGSRDPRAAATVRALARAVGAGTPGGDVRAAFLELAAPHLSDVLAGLGDRPAVVVPLLLTPAYHARTDLPGVVAAARDGGARVAVAEVLGPLAGRTGTRVPPELIAALRARLGGAPGPVPVADPDAVVLAAAGSRDPAALASVGAVAAALGAATGLPCRPGYVTGIGEPVAAAVGALRADGARSVVIASYFLAPGLLYDRAVGEATESAGARVAPPLGAHPGLVALVRRRVREAPAPTAVRTALVPAA
jgi:sirohydrochlorin ferrochelatase